MPVYRVTLSNGEVVCVGASDEAKARDLAEILEAPKALALGAAAPCATGVEKAEDCQSPSTPQT